MFSLRYAQRRLTAAPLLIRSLSGKFTWTTGYATWRRTGSASRPTTIAGAYSRRSLPCRVSWKSGSEASLASTKSPTRTSSAAHLRSLQFAGTRPLDNVSRLLLSKRRVFLSMRRRSDVCATIAGSRYQSTRSIRTSRSGKSRLIYFVSTCTLANGDCITQPPRGLATSSPKSRL